MSAKRALGLLGIAAFVWPGVVCVTVVPTVFLWQLALPRSVLFEFILMGTAMVGATLASVRIYSRYFQAPSNP